MAAKEMHGHGAESLALEPEQVCIFEWRDWDVRRGLGEAAGGGREEEKGERWDREPAHQVCFKAGVSRAKQGGVRMSESQTSPTVPPTTATTTMPATPPTPPATQAPTPPGIGEDRAPDTAMGGGVGRHSDFYEVSENLRDAVVLRVSCLLVVGGRAELWPILTPVVC